MLDFLISWLNINITNANNTYNNYYQYIVMTGCIICILFANEILHYIRLAINAFFNNIRGKD